MTATPARDSDSEMEEMPLRERMAKFDEELAEHRGLVERLAPGPPKVIAPLTVAEAFDLLDAAKAKDQVRHPPTPDPDPRPTSEARGSRDVTKIRNSTARTLRGEAARDARDARNPATALIPCRTDVYFSIPLPVIWLFHFDPSSSARSNPHPPETKEGAPGRGQGVGEGDARVVEALRGLLQGAARQRLGPRRPAARLARRRRPRSPRAPARTPRRPRGRTGRGDVVERRSDRRGGRRRC